MKAKEILKYIFSFMLAFGLMWYVYRDQDLSKIWEEAKKTNLFWIGLSALAAVAAHLSRAYRWNMLLKPMGYQPSLLSTFNAVMVGYAANFVVPRMGEVTRCGLLYRSDKVPFNNAFGTVVAERVFDLITMASLMGLTFLIEFDRLMVFTQDMLSRGPQQADNNSKFFILGGIVGAVVVIGTLAWLFRKQLLSNPLIIKVFGFLKGLADGVMSIKNVENKFLFIFHSLFIWGMYYCMMYFALMALPETSHLTPAIGLSMLMISSMGMIIPTPGGIGAYHYLVTQGLVMYGVSEANGAIFAGISHSLQILEIVMLTGATLILSSIFTGKKDNDTIGAKNNDTATIA